MARSRTRLSRRRKYSHGSCASARRDSLTRRAIQESRTSMGTQRERYEQEENAPLEALAPKLVEALRAPAAVLAGVGPVVEHKTRVKTRVHGVAADQWWPHCHDGARQHRSRNLVGLGVTTLPALVGVDVAADSFVAGRASAFEDLELARAAVAAAHTARVELLAGEHHTVAACGARSTCMHAGLSSCSRATAPRATTLTPQSAPSPPTRFQFTEFLQT